MDFLNKSHWSSSRSKHFPRLSASLFKDGSYQYEPLTDAKSFRVLELLPGKENDTIKLRLHLVNLALPPDYEAISYVWGSLADLVSCKCNGKKILITKSLHSALQHLRNAGTPRMLWADAICINQLDTEERGIQVRNMKSIYEAARSTLIFLGPDPDGLGKVAIDIFKSIQDKHHVPISTLKDIDDMFGVSGNYFGDEDYTSIEPEGWVAIKWFFNHPWFERLWVIQELNAGSDAVTICGPSQINSHLIALVANGIKGSQMYVTNRMDKTNLNQASYMRWANFRNPNDLLLTFHCGSTYGATDPRDRIYAMLGLPGMAEIRDTMQIDYSLSTSDVYANIFNSLLRVHNDLNTLSYVIHRKDRALNRPSWIPRWDLNSNEPVIWSVPNWNACMDIEPVAVIDSSNSTLTLQGWQLDAILECQRLDEDVFGFNPLNSDDPDVENWSKAWRDFLRPLPRYTTSSERIKAYAATLACGIDSQERKGDVNELHEEFSKFITWACGKFSPLPKESREYGRLILSKEQTYYSNNFRRSMYNWNYKRRFFTTQSGYMGNGPMALQKEDVVCIFKGGKVPFVLRPEGDQYILIGEAYVHGVMDGEAIVREGEGRIHGLQSKDFVLA